MIAACQVISSLPALSVWWYNGPSEFFELWSYNPTANSYTEIIAGLAAIVGAAVTAGPTTVFSISGSPVLQGGSDGSVQAAALSEYGGTGGNALPQLQFLCGGQRMATVSASGLRVKGITEGTPATGNLFQIFAAGRLAGTISSAGQLLATAVEESL